MSSEQEKIDLNALNMKNMGIMIASDWFTEILNYYVENNSIGDVLELLFQKDEETFIKYCKEHLDLIVSEEIDQACVDAGYIHPENYEPDRDENG